jgi:hypothetical protein
LGAWLASAGAPPLTQSTEAALAQAGTIRPSERRTVVCDQHGAELALAGGSVHWNAYRSKYVAIVGAKLLSAATTGAGSPSPSPPSVDGEIYYAEGDTLTSGWSNATLVITHAESGYSCYNPFHIPQLDANGGARIFITCTMTNSFSRNAHKEPKYDYNNMVFALDL